MRKAFHAFLLAILGYFSQVSIMPYLALGGITPNVLLAVIAIATVVYSRFYTFGISAIAGILMEIMTAGVPNFNLVIYPAIGFLGSLLFADKSERRLEQELSVGKKGRNMPAHLRTILCITMNSIIFELIHITFIYLTGVDIGWIHIGRSLWMITYTVGITVVIMIPIRYALGMYSWKIKKQQAV